MGASAEIAGVIVDEKDAIESGAAVTTRPVFFSEIRLQSPVLSGGGMRLLFVCACVAGFAVSAAASSFPLQPYVGGRAVTHTVPGRTTAMYAGGRVVLRRTPAKSSYDYAWPGVYFTARFDGPSVAVAMDDPRDNLHLYVDGKEKLTLNRPGKTTVTLDHLGQGPHVVRLEKASETQDAGGRFGGFTVTYPDEALPPPHFSRHIEFIGDSHTVGYGNTSRGRVCTAEDVRETTDTSLAFAPLTAKHFGAAYRINAYSGDGVVRNYAGIRPGITLPVLYRYALFDGKTLADDAGWTPDVVVIDLGTNDFSTPLGPNEKWKTREDLHADFVRTYVAFVQSLHAKWPQAHFILMAATDMGTEIPDQVSAVADILKKDTAISLEYIPLNNLGFEACHFHPSLKDDKTIAQVLVEHIERLPKFANAGS